MNNRRPAVTTCDMRRAMDGGIGLGSVMGLGIAGNVRRSTSL